MSAQVRRSSSVATVAGFIPLAAALTERVARSGNPVNPARHDQPRSWTPYGIRFWPLLLTFAVGTVVTLIVEFSQNPPKIL